MDNAHVRKVIMKIFKTKFAKNAQIIGIIILIYNLFKVLLVLIIRIIIKYFVPNVVKIIL